MARTATAQSKSAPKRTDPRRLRPVDGTSPWAVLINQDPTKKYVLANKADQFQGAAYYEAIGYDVELVQEGKDALRFLAGRNGRVGEPLENFGHVVMSIDLERWNEIEKYGIAGGRGQDGADKIERRIVDHESGIDDPLRGLGAGYLGIANETRRLKLETPTVADTSDDDGEDHPFDAP